MHQYIASVIICTIWLDIRSSDQLFNFSICNICLKKLYWIWSNIGIYSTLLSTGLNHHCVLIILMINDLLPLHFYQGEYFSINVVLEISTCMRLLVLISFDDSVNHDRMIEHGGNRQTYIYTEEIESTHLPS